MKLAILGSRGIPARYGGFETFAEELAVGLCARGVEVTVFCETNSDSQPNSLRGVTLRYVSAPQLGPLKTILYDAKCIWAARKGFDVVYMLGYGAAPFCIIPRFWGSIVWINPDGLEWARAKWGLMARTYFHVMEWISLRVANRIVADADAIEASLISRHGKLSCCTVIPYGCEVVEDAPSIEPLAPWGLAPGSYYLLVCRLEPENHVLEILQGFQRSQSTRTLIVLGNHQVENDYVAALREVKDTRIKLIGAIYENKALTALRYHAFGYFHGHSVGGTNPSLLEAMGCGNLIVAHDNPFNRETLAAGGLFFKTQLDLAEIVDSIEKQSIDADSLRAGARVRASSHYRWPEIIDRYAALLGLPGRP